MATYNRYKSFTGEDGTLKIVPFIPIRNQSTDKYVYWVQGRSRMDLISYTYYNDPGYRWLILQANPHLPSIEFMIENGERIRVPYPLDTAITMYENDIKVYEQLEGGF